MRGLMAAVMLALVAMPMPRAEAGDQPGVLRRVSCTVVRFYVGKYSVSAAEGWARSHGATDAEIEAARRCLTSGPTQTAAIRQ